MLKLHWNRHSVYIYLYVKNVIILHFCSFVLIFFGLCVCCGWIYQDWDLKLQQTMVEMFPLRSADAAYNKISGMVSSLGDPFTRIISPKVFSIIQVYFYPCNFDSYSVCAQEHSMDFFTMRQCFTCLYRSTRTSE